MTGLDRPLHAVFIRAPLVERVGPGVEVLATVDDRPVCCRERTVMVSSFHPELSDDTRLAETLDLLRAHPSFRQAEDDVRRRAADARKLLADLPQGPARQALDSLCDLVATRSV